MPTPTVRLAHRRDLPQLPPVERQAASLFRDCLAETGLTEDALERVTPNAVLTTAVQRGRLWVAEISDGVVVGFGLVSEVGGYAHLDELSVRPSHGRQGVGTAILEAVRDAAAQAGCPGLTLTTYRDVPWNAPFYRRRGFTVVEPSALSSAHVRLVAAEARRGLRTDRRVLMRHPLPA